MRGGTYWLYNDNGVHTGYMLGTCLESLGDIATLGLAKIQVV